MTMNCGGMDPAQLGTRTDELRLLGCDVALLSEVAIDAKPTNKPYLVVVLWNGFYRKSKEEA